MINIKVYNEEGTLVANDMNTILEVLENNGYHTNMSKEEAKKLRIERGVSDEWYIISFNFNCVINLILILIEL